MICKQQRIDSARAASGGAASPGAVLRCSGALPAARPDPSLLGADPSTRCCLITADRMPLTPDQTARSMRQPAAFTLGPEALGTAAVVVQWSPVRSVVRALYHPHSPRRTAGRCQQKVIASELRRVSV